jgi:tetratricopeptide (TPR) repeat protein
VSDFEQSEALRAIAVDAFKAGAHDDAVLAWRAHEQRFGISGLDWLTFSISLEFLGEIASALRALQSFSRQSSAEPDGLFAEAAIHVRLGNLAAARRCLAQAVERTVDTTLEGQARHACAVQAIAVGCFDEAMGDLELLDQLAPQDGSALLRQTEIHLKNRDIFSVKEALARAALRFPEDQRFLQMHAKLLNAHGSDDELLAFAAQLLSLNLSDKAIVSAFTLLVRKRQYHFSRAFRERLLTCFRSTSAAAAIEKMLMVTSPPSTETLIELARKAVVKNERWPNSPGSVLARGRLAEVLIEAGCIDEAIKLVEQLEKSINLWPYPPPKLGRLMEWAMIRRGDVQQAQTSYWDRRRMIANRDRTDELEAIQQLSGSAPSSVVFCVLRNEITVIPTFFRHYRKIGVERFVIIDNGSTDGSLEWLSAQPDVELYRTPASFRRADAGNYWTNPLIADVKYRDTLCLRVDADEHLVYPHFERRSIGQLWDYMRSEGADVLAGHMVDMMPEKMSDLEGLDSDFTKVTRFFDPAPPPTPAVICPYFRYSGGPRTRLLGGKEQFLTKCSGLRGGGKIEQISASHTASPAIVASVRMALLHYKFRPDMFDRARRIVTERQYSASSQEFQNYGQFEIRKDASMLGANTREYTGSKSLIDSAVLVTCRNWDMR